MIWYAESIKGIVIELGGTEAAIGCRSPQYLFNRQGGRVTLFVQSYKVPNTSYEILVSHNRGLLVF